jgi:ABC-type transport system involved in multi-copper enzyme maturation permease subunit
MKFLAILRDSVREAIDAKVFYVMVGLSAFLILLALTVTFRPAEPPKAFMEKAIWLANMRAEEGALAFRDPGQILGHLLNPAGKGPFTLESVKVVEGPADSPGSRYSVIVRGQFPTAASANKVRQQPDDTLSRLRDRFGNLLGVRMVEVLDARLVQDAGRGGRAVDFELTTGPSRATRRLWKSNVSLLFGLVPLSFLDGAPLGAQLFRIENTVVNGFGAWVAILVSVIITAFFIPNMLRKGSVDLLLVKPIRRSTLLVYKYVGGLAFIFLNTSLAVGGMWLALGLRSGVWAPGFLLSIPVITFFFAILYSVSTLFGVLTRSPIAAILLTCLVWFCLFLVGLLFSIFEMQVTTEGRRAWHEAMNANRPPSERKKYEDDGLTPDERRQQQGWFANGIRKMHYILPRTSDLDQLMNRVLVSDLLFANELSGGKLDTIPITWRESLTVSIVFITLMLGLACWRFSATDY